MNLNLKWLIVTITASLGRTQQDGADKNCINFFYCHFPFSPGHHLYSMYKFVCIFEGPTCIAQMYPCVASRILYTIQYIQFTVHTV